MTWSEAEAADSAPFFHGDEYNGEVIRQAAVRLIAVNGRRASLCPFTNAQKRAGIKHLLPGSPGSVTGLHTDAVRALAEELEVPHVGRWSTSRLRSEVLRAVGESPGVERVQRTFNSDELEAVLRALVVRDLRGRSR